MASAAPTPMKIRFDAFELDAASGELRKAGILLKLQPQPFRVLLLLIEQAGQVVTREEIQRCLWKDSTFVDFEHGINFSINQIRGALADNAEKPRYIETLPRRGYRFIGTVEHPSPGSTALKRKAELERERAVSRRQLAIASLAAIVAATSAAEAYFHFHRARPLTEKDTVVLADFTNMTGDAVFDGTLRQGLEIQLEQSPFLSLISESRVQQTLRLMGKPPDTRLTPEITRDLCQRAGSKAYIGSSITNLGNDYVIGLDAVNCSTGESLAKEQVQATGKEKVLDALGRAAGKLRTKLGESLSTVQAFDTPIEQATTASLEALQAYSLARKLQTGRNDKAGAVPFFQRAVSLDPNFAMAYASLASSYYNLGEPSLGADNTRKAYNLRERVSERERFYIESHYHHFVTGDLVKARQAYELWAQTYPRDAGPRNQLGIVYLQLGQTEKALAEARETNRLAHNTMSYSNLIISYLYLNRLKEARATAEEAQANKINPDDLPFDLYLLGFLENDEAGMERQVALFKGKPEIEAGFLYEEADRAAYAGQLEKAREFSRRAVAMAKQAKQKEAPASFEAESALREALFGNAAEARTQAAAALGLSTGRDVQYGAALALAFASDVSRARVLADDLAKRFPEDTLVQFNYLPTIRAQLMFVRNHPDESSRTGASKAIEILRAAGPYELGLPGGSAFTPSLYPVYVRGQAYLAERQGGEAATEFQKILDWPGVVQTEPIGALARLGLGRAYLLQGDTARARAAYQDFLTLWKDADPDIPVLKQAKAEYAKLQ